MNAIKDIFNIRSCAPKSDVDKVSLLSTFLEIKRHIKLIYRPLYERMRFRALDLSHYLKEN